MEYKEFLKSKHLIAKRVGFDVSPDDINPSLFPFQRDIVRWALRLGRAAIFAKMGLGKTLMQLEWAKHVAAHTGKPVLILTPLAVAHQTKAEAIKFNVVILPEAEIINYEQIHKLNLSQYSGVVLDESSLLKHYSKTFFELTAAFEHTPYRLCCTATPSPNDIVEIGNHSTFLGIMDFHDMLARFFVGEGKIARRARLTKHGEKRFLGVAHLMVSVYQPPR